jgi:LDH2 family malate/lactate/ureidoglycolate dehydrogenase
MDTLIGEIKALPKAEGSSRIYLPGEMEWERRQIALREGIMLPPDVVTSLQGLAEDLNMSTELFREPVR